MRRKALKNAVFRVLRGGSFYDDSRGLRTTSRAGAGPEYRDGDCGFRLIARKVR